MVSDSYRIKLISFTNPFHKIHYPQYNQYVNNFHFTDFTILGKIFPIFLSPVYSETFNIIFASLILCTFPSNGTMDIQQAVSEKLLENALK